MSPMYSKKRDNRSSTTLIMSPMNSRLRYWQIFMVIMVAYSAWTYPFQAAFLKPSAQSLRKIYIADNIINVFFLFDIILKFFVGYFDPKTLLFVRDPKSIARRYLSTWFIPDVASTLPIELVFYFLYGKYSMCLLYIVLGLIRLSRLRHVARFFTRLEMDIRFSYLWVRCARILCVTLFSVHYYFLPRWNPYEDYYRNAAEKVFLFIYSFFFNIGIRVYAIRSVYRLIYMFFDGRAVEFDIKKLEYIDEFLELLLPTGEEDVDEDQNMSLHLMTADALLKARLDPNTRDSKRRYGSRVAIFKGLPKVKTNRRGVLILLPSSLTELKVIAGEIFGFDATNAKVRNKDGDEVTSISVIRDNEKLFIGDTP
ncbi:potassium transport 2/3 [Artemisia annua]|uniref:Potassium transport 2/3 n=1 Tax=Artemisia annua TaxID=35608 RepID=A0A2U1PMR7_ARTAN|nr:potassium transport 2/3 [Artemisia annua]